MARVVAVADGRVAIDRVVARHQVCVYRQSAKTTTLLTLNSIYDSHVFACALALALAHVIARICRTSRGFKNLATLSHKWISTRYGVIESKSNGPW